MSATSTRAMISLNAVILPVKIIAPSLFVRHDKTSWERLNVTFLNKKFSSWMITGKIHGNTLFVWYFSLWYCNAMILTDTDFRQNHCAMILKSIFVKIIASFKYNVKYCFHGSIRLLFSQKELKTEFRSQETRSRWFHGFRFVKSPSAMILTGKIVACTDVQTGFWHSHFKSDRTKYH